MASDALFASRSSPASSSGIALHESLKPSKRSFLPLSGAKGVRSRQRLVVSLASPQNSLCCQAATPLPMLAQCPGSDASASELQVSPDRWMEGCVRDIVRNIKEAPFLHMLYDPDHCNSCLKSRRQRVVESENLSVDDKWKEMKDLVRDASPDGVILVHQLNAASVEGCCMSDELSLVCKEYQIVDKRSRQGYDSTKLWGVLVLGKTIAKSACYILQTTSVASSAGTCTQFCLTKAKCFGPSWNEQMQNCWLVNSGFGDHPPCSSVLK